MSKPYHVAKLTVVLALAFSSVAVTPAQAAEEKPEKSLLGHLDVPLLFVKRHAYMAGHIYDDYITWRPGGGIYVIENPWDPPEKRTIRAVIDPTTKETLGVGVYRDPELSWDAKRIVFALKSEQHGHTSIYEIGVDGTGLRRLTDPSSDCEHPPQEIRTGRGHHDITPSYLPDGRIVFTSTRPRALVPCFNSGVDTLHVMDADGGNIRSISVNNVNEFDPAVLPDGRILYGRWEYVDKTALYMQSLWTVSPDSRMEAALFANNLAKPTAVLDARPVPNSNLIVAAFTPHNGQAVGAIAMIDPHGGKNDLGAVFNFTPEYPTKMDQGLRQGPSDPWPISEDVVLIANNAKGRGVIQIIDRSGHRELVHSEPDIDCYAPMLIKPRRRPLQISPHTQTTAPGRFLVVDVHQGLAGVKRGTVKRLRIVEETARISGLPPGGRWWNQAFLVSWQGAYIIKNILGTVPVHEDGSAYFEVPPGRAIYFEALDADGREVQRMRTFVQAAPGVTRSCVGCHESKKSAAPRHTAPPMAMLGEPARPEPESWGSVYIDYPTMVQPVLDKHCVRCHGGEKGMAKGLDLSGGWTWAFSISYETLIKHRLVGFLNCNNGSVHTSELLAPRTIGSGGAKLGEIIVKKHPELSPAERDLLLAWMDTNSNYYGTWDYTQYATCNAILGTAGPLAAVMKDAGCTECHAAGHIGNDWVNLQTPEWSRILRAPMAKSKGSLGLAFCRKRKARHGYPLVTQREQPPDVIRPTKQPKWDASGEAHVAFASADDEHYQAMVAIIRKARAEALAHARVDMPGAEIVPGECRMMVLPPVPESAPALSAKVREDFLVELSWARTAETIGLHYALHRGDTPSFTPDGSTQIAMTMAGRFADVKSSPGMRHYALVVTSGDEQSQPARVSIEVPKPPPPPVPTQPTARAWPGEIVIDWGASDDALGVRYDVLRAKAGTQQFEKVNAGPLRTSSFSDLDVDIGTRYAYVIRALDKHGRQSSMSTSVEAAPLPQIREPVFVARFVEQPAATLLDGKEVKGRLHAGATAADGALQLGSTGFASFDHLPEFDLGRAISVECWVWIDKKTEMPVILSCGHYLKTGWFVQRYRDGWRWHLGGQSCDGGRPAERRWVHLVATFNGSQASLYQDGKQVASVACSPTRDPWDGPLVIGQYSGQNAQCQVTGRIAGTKIYRRALKLDEIAAAFRAGPSK